MNNIADFIKTHRERTIERMHIGDEGWAVSWAAYVVDNRAYLNPHYSINNSPGGTVNMFVRRVVDGFEVYFPEKESLSSDSWLYRSAPIVRFLNTPKVKSLEEKVELLAESIVKLIEERVV